MTEEQLRKLAKEYLLPLFSGARLEEGSVPSTGREHLASRTPDVCTIKFKANREDNYRLVLKRSQPFEAVRAGKLSECDVVEAFVQVVGRMSHGLSRWYSADLRATFPRRVVAKSLCSTEQGEEAVLEVIDQLTEWAGREYEGKSIPASVGFTPVVLSNQGVPFLRICEHDFSAVLSNGFDTLLVCSLLGRVLGHESLPQPAPNLAPRFAPYRFSAIATWAKDGHVAFALNRAGEILVFRDRELCFTRRAGSWHFLTHKPILTQMARPDDMEVRRAVYETALDASFARTGACIGIVTSGNLHRWKSVATSDKDYLANPRSTKSKMIARMVGGHQFQQLPRPLRQELVAIDGATLIDHHGKVLAVGAILQIPGGSAGGGRLAAAKALSTLGVGIKVSQDGGIRGFHDGNVEPKFLIM